MTLIPSNAVSAIIMKTIIIILESSFGASLLIYYSSIIGDVYYDLNLSILFFSILALNFNLSSEIVGFK